MKNLPTIISLLFIALVTLNSCQKEHLTEEFSTIKQQQSTANIPTFSLENIATATITLPIKNHSGSTSRSGDPFYEKTTSVDEGKWYPIAFERALLPDICTLRASLTPLSGEPNLYVLAYNGTDYRIIRRTEEAGLTVEDITGSIADLKADDTHLLFAIHGSKAARFTIELFLNCTTIPEPAAISLDNIDFTRIQLKEGMYWTYNWTYDYTNNLDARPRQTGAITITLTEKLDHIKEVDFFKAKISYAGSAYPYAEKIYWSVMGIKKDGTILVGNIDENEVVTARPTFAGTFLFRPLAANDWLLNGEGHITNPFNSNYSTTGVSLRQLSSDGGCEVIGNHTFCDDDYHSREVEEYYITGKEGYTKGSLFAGLSRTDTHVFSGVYPSIIERKFNCWLVKTNLF